MQPHPSKQQWETGAGSNNIGIPHKAKTQPMIETHVLTGDLAFSLGASPTSFTVQFTSSTSPFSPLLRRVFTIVVLSLYISLWPYETRLRNRPPVKHTLASLQLSENVAKQPSNQYSTATTKDKPYQPHMSFVSAMFYVQGNLARTGFKQMNSPIEPPVLPIRFLIY